MNRARIHDVAREAGVSITTVSKALNHYPGVNPETRRRIEEIAQKLNYVPDMAGRMMGGITERTIGLLINDLRQTDPSGAVFGTLSGVCTACSDNGIGFILITTDETAQKELSLERLCLSKNLDGLACVGFRVGDPYIDQLRTLNIPCAIIDMELNDPNVIDVIIDDVSAADKAVSFLLESGRRTIALINGSADADVSVRRGQGYRNALARAGVPCSEELLRDAGFDEELARRAAEELLAEYPEIDAFFCASDIMAFGVCHAIEESGKTIGEEIAVVGFDDIPTARFLYGGLTTVRQNFYERGYSAGSAVYSWIQEGLRPEPSRDTGYELVVRDTAK